MNRVNRAKLFVPFDALKGLQEALREKEREVEERKELSEESLMELEEKLNRIENGDKIKIRYYSNMKYTDRTGIVTGIDYRKKKIILDNEIKINIYDIILINIDYSLNY